MTGASGLADLASGSAPLDDGRAAHASPRPTFILNFHGLGPPPATVPLAEHEYWLAPERFAALLVTARELTAASGVDLAITFDDGNRSDWAEAVPRLEALGLRASFFVLAGRLNRPGYLSPADLRELARRGMTIGSHGFDHVDWRGCAAGELDRELIGARRVIEDAVGAPVTHVGVPFGAYDRRVLKRLRALGYTAIHTSDGGFAPRLGLRPRNTMRATASERDLARLFARERTTPRRLRRRLATARRVFWPIV